MRTYVRMIVCILLPLLSLRAALGERQVRLNEPVAVAPREDGPARIGEVSPVARALGVSPGMRLGEAVDVCPPLGLIPADPARADAIHESLLTRLESVGAAVESERSGEAFFAARGVERLYGGLVGVLEATRRAVGRVPVLSAAPTRLAAFALARSTGTGETATLPPERLDPFLSGLSLEILSGRLGLSESRESDLLRSMTRLNLNRLGDLATLSAGQVSDRFGPAGSRARMLALGREPEIRARRIRERIGETVELPEQAAGTHLAAGLSILSDRVSARLGAAGLSARTLSFEATLAEGGSWSREFTPRRPTAAPHLLRTLLAPVPEQLPRPASSLHLRVTSSAPADPEQLEVRPRPEETRRSRLDEAARQVRAAVGDAGLMRVLEAESGSRLPERRVLLGPYLDG